MFSRHICNGLNAVYAGRMDGCAPESGYMGVLFAKGDKSTTQGTAIASHSKKTNKN